jgi:hypothetical protein
MVAVEVELKIRGSKEIAASLKTPAGSRRLPFNKYKKMV